MGTIVSTEGRGHEGLQLNVESGQAERFMWPGFLAKLRESFSLDPLPGGENSVLDPAPTVSRSRLFCDLVETDGKYSNPQWSGVFVRLN